MEVEIDSGVAIGRDSNAEYPKRMHVVCKILKVPFAPGHKIKKANQNSKFRFHRSTNLESDSDEGGEKRPKRKKKAFDELLQSDDSSSDNWNS